MANEMFGGLLRGLSSFMPQDDPNTKIFNLNNEISDLQQEETQLYATIGRKLFDSIRENPEYSDIIEELFSVQRRLKQAKTQLKTVQEEKEELEKRKEALRCPECGTENPEGVKFCKECGCKMGSSACSNCGTVNPPLTRFCGECGNKLM